MMRRKLNSVCIGRWTQSGQAIVEGAAIVPVMIVLAVVCVYLLLNASILGTYSYRINAIASESARQMNAGRWWLGMERTGFIIPAAEGDVRALVEAEVKAMGWPGAKVSNFAFNYDRATAGDQPLNLVRVSFDVSGIKVHSGGIFPSTVTLHASGMCSDAEFAVPRHGMATIHAIDPEPPYTQRVVRVPVYNTTVGNSIPANSRWLRADTSLGTSPVVNMNVYCEHSGILNLNRTFPNGTSAIVDTAPW
jgi:hypothetical protein